MRSHAERGNDKFSGETSQRALSGVEVRVSGETSQVKMSHASVE
jgi:hypothetical protein